MNDTQGWVLDDNKMYRECKGWFGHNYDRIEVDELEFSEMGKQGSCIRKIKKASARQDSRSAPDALLPFTALQPEDEQPIPIKPGRMVDVAIREFGAKITEVELIEGKDMELTFERN